MPLPLLAFALLRQAKQGRAIRYKAKINPPYPFGIRRLSAAVPHAVTPEKVENRYRLIVGETVLRLLTRKYFGSDSAPQDDWAFGGHLSWRVAGSINLFSSWKPWDTDV